MVVDLGKSVDVIPPKVIGDHHLKSSLVMRRGLWIVETYMFGERLRRGKERLRRGRERLRRVRERLRRGQTA
jgi:hypothetical protein